VDSGCGVLVGGVFVGSGYGEFAGGVYVFCGEDVGGICVFNVAGDVSTPVSGSGGLLLPQAVTNSILNISNMLILLFILIPPLHRRAS